MSEQRVNMDLNQLIDECFDLSFLGTENFAKTDYKSILLLGGGTAGYLSALALKKTHPYLDIKIVESSKIPVIGVGESTTTEIIPFLHHFLGIDPVDFFQEVKPTFKLGIQFDWGKKNERPFHFNFFAGHLFENLHYKNHTGSFNWPAQLMYDKKFPVISTGDGGFYSLLNSIPFAYHLENRSLITYLKKKIIENDIAIIDEEITRIERDSEGNLLSLITNSMEKLEADFFIDCSGFRSKLLGDELQEDFISYEDSLFCDKAITFNLSNNMDPAPYTEAITMNCGWCWRIPLRDEDHLGYVFSSKYLSEEDAIEEIKNKFNPNSEQNFKVIPFKTGRHKRALVNNMMAIGNSYAFIEPLESTAIQTLVQSIMILCRLFPKNNNDQISKDAINKEISENWDSFKAFLAVHYKFNEKLDTQFWQEVRQSVSLDRAESIISLYHQKAPLSYTHFGNNHGYTALESLVFNSYSYDSLLMGQGLLPNSQPKPRFSKEELEARLESYKKMSEIAFSQKELFENQELFIEGIWQELFANPDSWINETNV